MDSPKDEENLGLPDEEPEAPKVLRRLGMLDGQFNVPDDFDTMMAEEIEEMFYGKPDKFSDLLDGNNESQVSASAFPRKKQLAFALLVFERMLPSLVAFSKATGFDDSCYLHAKDAAWAALENAPVDQSLNWACRSGAPDTEEYGNELTSFPLDAALAMSDIMEFAQDGCADHITSVSTRAGESVYLYLNGLDDSAVIGPEKVSQIASHPLMQEEHRREEADIRFLASLPDQFNDETILSLRARADSQPPLLPLTYSPGGSFSGG